MLLSILAPSRCAACDAPCSSHALLCVGCAATVQRNHDARAPFIYGGALATAITRFKYGSVPELARPLGALLAAEAMKIKIARDAVVVPVPLHPSRLYDRGFNQAALLARPVAKALRLVLDARTLARVRETAQQAELDRDARLRNVLGAFRARREIRTPVLLIDDVRTTGATQEACADALRDARCPHVQCLVLAIAPSPV